MRTGSNGSPWVCWPWVGRVDLDALDGLLADLARAVVPDLVAPLALRAGVGAVVHRADRPVGLGDPGVDRLGEHALRDRWLSPSLIRAPRLSGPSFRRARFIVVDVAPTRWSGTARQTVGP